MGFKIGFTAEREHNEPTAAEHTAERKVFPVAKKSVVDVFFPDRHLTCSYYNDRFDLQCGDTVYVEGKLEGLRGRVVAVNDSFRIKLSQYKRVIGVADTDVTGEFHLAGSHLITVDEGALCFEQAASWFKAPESEEEEYVSSSGDDSFSLDDLSGMSVPSEIAERGHRYYMENRVAYLELRSGRGRALVLGSRTYEVEFAYENGNIRGLVCDCYCTGACKHEFATMLQLRDLLAVIKREYPSLEDRDYLAAVSKASFFEFVIDGKDKGTFTMG